MLRQKSSGGTRSRASHIPGNQSLECLPALRSAPGPGRILRPQHWFVNCCSVFCNQCWIWRLCDIWKTEKNKIWAKYSTVTMIHWLIFVNLKIQNVFLRGLTNIFWYQLFKFVYYQVSSVLYDSKLSITKLNLGLYEIQINVWRINKPRSTMPTKWNSTFTV